MHVAVLRTTTHHNSAHTRTKTDYSTRLQHAFYREAWKHLSSNTHRRGLRCCLLTLTVKDYAVAVRVQPTEASEEDEHGGVDPMVGQRVLQGGCAAGHVSKNDILESVRGDAVAVPERRGNTQTCVFVSVHGASHTRCIAAYLLSKYNGNGTQHIIIKHNTFTSMTTTDMNSTRRCLNALDLSSDLF